MNLENGWTKEMFDVIKDCEISPLRRILMKLQSIHYNFTDENNFDDTEKISESYEGLFDRGAYCYDDIDNDYDEDKYMIWKRIEISIQFYDHDTRNFGGKLTDEVYKYGYLIFWNQKSDNNSPALTIGLNKTCGIKEKIDDLFLRFKIFNYKDLKMDIEYDVNFIKDIEFDKLITAKPYYNLVPIKSISLGARFGLD